MAEKWHNVNQGDRPCSAMEVCLACNGHGAFFPNLKTLLRAFATLPRSTATAEISFSTMKIIKPSEKLHSDSRLTGLALISVHHNIPVSPSEVSFTVLPKHLGAASSCCQIFINERMLPMYLFVNSCNFLLLSRFSVSPVVICDFDIRVHMKRKPKKVQRHGCLLV
jgi:hypothetical protein